LKCAEFKHSNHTKTTFYCTSHPTGVWPAQMTKFHLSRIIAILHNPVFLCILSPLTRKLTLKTERDKSQVISTGTGDNWEGIEHKICMFFCLLTSCLYLWAFGNLTLKKMVLQMA
jgi:hypothetical protein